MTHIEKFDNFKRFCTTIPGINPSYVLAIQQCGFLLFMEGVKGKIKEGKNVEEMIKECIEKTGLNPDIVDVKIKEKFCRYLTYFYNLAKIL